MVALYPSMKAQPTATIAYQSIKKSKIKFNSLNLAFAMIFLLLSLGSETMNAIGLGEAIPRRKSLKEYYKDKAEAGENFKIRSSDGGNPRSLGASINRTLLAWDFTKVKLDDYMKREILARVIQIMVLILMTTHSYRFGGKLYKQKTGAPIGLRASACLAKILMAEWDMVWAKTQQQFRLKVQLLYRYVDDIRVYLFPINLGWIWSKDGWTWSTPNDNDQSDIIEHTKQQLKKSFEAVFDFLKFTTEDGNEYSDGMLPTLDFKTLTMSDGIIKFEFFQKAMENNRVLDRTTALSKGTIFSALRQNMVRRLLNTSQSTCMNKRLLIVEKFIQLMVNSGHKFQFIRSIIQQALTKYLYMVERSKLDVNDKRFQPLYRPPEFRSAERIMLKYVESQIWYKRMDLGDEYRQSWKFRIKNKTTRNDTQSKSIGNIIRNIDTRLRFKNNNKNGSFRFEKETTTALFVPASSDGKLSENIMKVEEELSDSLDWRMKVVEASGSPIVQTLKPKFDMVEGCVLGADCVLCGNTGNGCGTKNIVYSAVSLQPKNGTRM